MSEERFYVVRDAAGAIYGPANIGTLRQWIGEGRITRQMHIAPQGTGNFIEAGQMPELAGSFPGDEPFTTTSPGAITTQTETPVAATAAQPSQNYYTNPQAYPQGYQQGYPYYAKSSGTAVAALICGIGSFAFCPCAIAAIILGHVARAQIRRDPDRYEGDGMALAGMIIGYIWLSLLLLIVLFYVVLIVIAFSMSTPGRPVV